MNASIRVRLTTLFVAVLAVTLFIFSSILFGVFNRNNAKEFDIALYNHAVDVAETINVDFFGEFVLRDNGAIGSEKIIPFALGRSFMQVVTSRGVIMARSTNLGALHLPIFSEDWQSVFQNGSAFRTLSFEQMGNLRSAQSGSNYRMITFLTQRNGEPAFILQIAVPMTLLDQQRSSLILFFLVGIPATLLLACIGGLYLSGKALAPVRAIILKADELNPSNLSERLPVSPVGDEIQQLTVTLNDMLARIQKAFESHEHFIADASHQLKTPIAILRGELDVFKGKARTPAETDIFLSSASQELLHLTRLLDDLLILAQVDAGAGTLSIRDVRLDEILLEAVARLELFAKRRGINIRFDLESNSAENAFVVKGDADLLQSMFRNLLDNALKYSPENSVVEVKIIDLGGTVLTEIKDYGEQIPSELVMRLFDRYYRNTHTKQLGAGSGLGLTIARRIAEMHRGNISVFQGKPPGKSFRVEMKKN